MARVLVCLSSLVRHFEVFWPTFQQQVLACLGPVVVDFVGYFPPMETEADQELVKEAISKSVSRYRIEFVPDPIFPPKQLTFDRYLSASAKSNGMRGNLLQWHSLGKVADLACSVEPSWGPYDTIIWSRPDLLFINPLEDHLHLDAIVIPSAENHFGYHDRFCYGPPILMDKRLRILPYFLHRWYPEVERRPRPVPHRWLGRLKIKSGWNPEVVLRDYLDEELRVPVKRTDLLTARVRKVKQEYFIIAPYHNQRCMDSPAGTLMRETLKTLERLDGGRGRISPMIPLRRVVEAFPHLEYLSSLCR